MTEASTVTLNGKDYPISTVPRALMRVEHLTGRTLFELVQMGATGALTIMDLSHMALAMVSDAPDDDALFGSPVQNAKASGVRVPSMLVEKIAEAVVDANPMQVAPQLVVAIARRLDIAKAA